MTPSIRLVGSIDKHILTLLNDRYGFLPFVEGCNHVNGQFEKITPRGRR
jgi:hypothetical protein